jgi:hypothetical protein
MRPHSTEGWIWGHELAAIKRAGLVDEIEVTDGWRMVGECEQNCPLAEVATLYKKRLDIGKESPLGKAIKLLMNSLYGKFAQSAGSRPWQNWLWASLITSGTRTMIFDAIATHPEGTKAVLMVATDAVYFSSPHPGLEVRDRSGRGPRDRRYDAKLPALGSWERKSLKGLCLFKPGFFWSKGSSDDFKARGSSASDLAPYRHKLECQFDELAERVRSAGRPLVLKDSDWPSLTYPVDFSITSMYVAAFGWNKWDTAGRQHHGERRTDSSWPAKRGEVVIDEAGFVEDAEAARETTASWDAEIGALRSSVPPGGGRSLPYSSVSQHSADLVDPYGDTDEGPVQHLVHDALMGDG